MKIALDAARGLAYLHEDSQPCVIHRDFKASNILLENNFLAKVSDFGLAKQAPEGRTNYLSTRVMGTFGLVIIIIIILRNPLTRGFKFGSLGTFSYNFQVRRP